jgi:hypothetical protein
MFKSSLKKTITDDPHQRDLPELLSFFSFPRSSLIILAAVLSVIESGFQGTALDAEPF